ncbi:RNA-binding protein [Candidatus Micrarchaeota archaeon CG08_land_8_20_14_0_20_49_17]|nr:MAG: RNA-binding protein [Candidatus Micrarchaeota archaeon CG08_land_8_20_14_0_20_49_17]PIU81634.1 MAG: RNA-binding protein [Candidatus Micrarchaeota archaeon CG06_land_8_20_14_3_00_50_6]
MMVEVLGAIKKETLKAFLVKQERFDGRKFDEYRPIEIQQNAAPNAEGSALVHLGKSQVLCGIKFGVGAPYADTPDEGVLSTMVELLPLASFTFEPGPPSPEAIELGRVVDRGIRSAKIIDMGKLKIDDEHVLMLYLDMYVLDHDGNLFDACTMAAMRALLDTQLPKVEEGKIIFGEHTGKLDVSGIVTTSTFAKIDGSLLLDPTLDEQLAMDTRLTIGVMGDKAVSMQKGLSGALTREELFQLLDIAKAKHGELVKYINL